MAAHAFSPSAEALTRLILALFRANNALTAWGDRLVADTGLTSARWQLMGAIAQAAAPQTVAATARDLGANRQNIQRIVNDLLRDGLVELAENPRHNRARLVLLTERGYATYEAALAAYAPEINTFSEDFDQEELARSLAVIEQLATVGKQHS